MNAQLGAWLEDEMNEDWHCALCRHLLLTACKNLQYKSGAEGI